jgi:hypothetical protein
LAQKNFNQIEYYNFTNAQIIIPTWYGIELSGGIQDLTGQRLNQDETNGKTSYAGISLPLAKNLIIDKRRGIFLKFASHFCCNILKQPIGALYRLKLNQPQE